MRSLTFYIALLAIKLKGIKSEFSKDPIDYVKLRKDDIHNPGPKKFKPHKVSQFRVAKTIVTEILPEKSNEHLVLFCHGGAFVYGPVEHHWDSARKIVSETGCPLWMIDYPKAPEHQIDTLSNNMDVVFAEAVKKYNAKNIILIGDSAGATLLTALVQRLILNKQNLPLLLILISPVMDATFSNPSIPEIDKKDPILSKDGALSAKKMCAFNMNLVDRRISPLFGSFEGFPFTILFLAEYDITYPDQMLAIKKIRLAGAPHKIYIGKKMPHIWPLLPVIKEGKVAFKQIIGEINNQIMLKASEKYS